MAEWMPIESAPRDGTRLILGHPSYVEFGYWNSRRSPWESHWCIVNNGDYIDGGHGKDYACGGLRIHDYKPPTHWMPLPEPPEVKP